MGETRLGFSWAEENRLLEGLIVFLTERAEGAGIYVPLGAMCSKVASTCTYLVNTATYEL